MSTYQPRLPGVDPIAVVRLAAYLHSEGFPSHYEVEGRGPTNNLVVFRAQGTAGAWDHDQHYVEMEAYFRATVSRALEELQADQFPNGPYQRPSGG